VMTAAHDEGFDARECAIHIHAIHTDAQDPRLLHGLIISWCCNR
jgi:hypothetical protein